MEREPKMSDDNFDRFTKCAVEVLGVDASKVTREANFADDLDADSLDLVELVMALEEEFDVSIEEEELAEVTTVGGAFDVLVSKL
jgi:acyl carrier protein